MNLLDWIRANRAEDERAQWMRTMASRDRVPASDRRRHNVLGPKEHAAYAQYQVARRPVLNTILQLGYIPAYTGAKALGILGGRSDATLDEMAEAYRGVGRGVQNAIADVLGNYSLTERANPGFRPMSQMIAQQARSAGQDPQLAVNQWLQRQRRR